jgi:UDP-glucose 4-epimerase
VRNILITGGAGYIGSHTVRLLLKSGYNCVVVDNLVNGHREAVPQDCLEVVDLLDTGGLSQVFNRQRIDAVIHFAAYISVGESVKAPQKYYENNVVGTLNLLDVMLSHDVKKIVFSSTCATYGNPKYVPIDEDHPQNPISPYGQSKLMDEKIFADFAGAYGLRYISLRYFNAAGAADDGSIGRSCKEETLLVPRAIRTVLGKQDYVGIFGTDYETADGTGVRDYIHVDDLSAAHLLALKKSDDFCGSLNLGTSKGYSVREIISVVEKTAGKNVNVKLEERREGDPACLVASNDRAQKILGWVPRYDIKHIVQTALNWEKNRKY